MSRKPQLHLLESLMVYTSQLQHQGNNQKKPRSCMTRPFFAEMSEVETSTAIKMCWSVRLKIHRYKTVI